MVPWRRRGLGDPSDEGRVGAAAAAATTAGGDLDLLDGLVARSRVPGADQPQHAVGDGPGLGVAEGLRLEQGVLGRVRQVGGLGRSEEHTSELQALMRNTNAVFCLKKK